MIYNNKSIKIINKILQVVGVVIFGYQFKKKTIQSCNIHYNNECGIFNNAILFFIVFLHIYTLYIMYIKTGPYRF